MPQKTLKTAIINSVSLTGGNRDLPMKPHYAAIIAHVSLASISLTSIRMAFALLIEIEIRKFPTAHALATEMHS